MDIVDILESWSKIFNSSLEEKEKAKERLEICKKCKNFSRLRVCKDCGCPVVSKVFTKTHPCTFWNS